MFLASRQPKDNIDSYPDKVCLHLRAAGLGTSEGCSQTKSSPDCHPASFYSLFRSLQRPDKILSLRQQAHESLTHMVIDDRLALDYLLARDGCVPFFPPVVLK